MSAEQHAPITPINTPATLDDLVARRASLKADIEYIQEELERVDAAIILRLGTVGTHDVNGTKVQIREYTRTDPKKIAADYPAGEYPQLYATAIDMDAVKAQFAPASLEAYTVHGKKSVVIK